jgi:hypothetical protein
MKTINRHEFLAEQLVRGHIRERIKHTLHRQSLAENKLRKIVRTILEAETGTEEPSVYTGINVLAGLLERIIPVLQDDYKMLTTSEEQRESFKNHIIHAIKNALKPIEAATDAEKLPENFKFDIDKSLLEKMKIDLDADEDMVDPETVEGEFIDIDSETQDDFVEIGDQNETGRNFASATFKKIEKQIVDSYDMLADEEDQKLFYDYLITNLLLYFDKFEDELQPELPDTTTPEYEEEKESESSPETEEENSEDLI